MLRNSSYDLIVIGGGPAGSTIATLVALQNYRVLLIERERFPRYQIGESLLPATIHGICPMLGLSEQIRNAGFVRKAGGTFRWGTNPKPWTFEFGLSNAMTASTSYAYQVERAKFDTMLLKNAQSKGVTVLQGHKADRAITENGRVTGIEYTDPDGVIHAAHAKYIADASGHQSSIRSLAGERIYSRFFQNVALFCYFENAKRLPPPNEGNILCAAFNEGWFWYIPLSPSLTSVGAVISKEHAERLKDGHEEAMYAFIASCPMIADYLSCASRVKGGAYGQVRLRKDYSYSNERFWVPGLVLIGDSACFIDPVFSSGVHLATYSGLLAARSINTCLSGAIDERPCFEEFESRYRREFRVFYDFLLAFYDTNVAEDSYFWTARKILNTPEKDNEAFARLVAGMSASGEPVYGTHEEFVQSKSSLIGLLDNQIEGGYSSHGARLENNPMLDEFFSEIVQVQTQATLGAARSAEKPLFTRGLVPSRDGLRWRHQGTTATA